MSTQWVVCHRCLGVTGGGVCRGCGEKFCNSHLTDGGLCEACFVAVPA